MKAWIGMALIMLVSGACLEAVSIPVENLFDQSVTLDDYLAYAALNNPGLEAAFNRWKAALERIPQVGALPDLRFNYGYFIESVETRVGPQRQKFGLSQVFPWFGKLNLKKGVAAEAAAAEKAIYEKKKQALFWEIKSAYYEYYFLGKAIAITKEHIQLVTRLEEVVRTRYKTGLVPHRSIIKAQVELGKLDDRLSTQREMQYPMMAQLNATMGLPDDTPLPWPGSLPFDDVFVGDEPLTNWLLADNPELQILHSLTRKEENAMKLARKANWPDLMLGVDYIETGEASMPDTSDSGKDPIIAMVSMNLPLWFGKNKAAENEAHLKQQSLESQLEDMAIRLISDLKMAQYRFNDATRKIGLYRDTLLPKAEQSLYVTQQDFETGKAAFDEVIDAERVLLEFQLAYERALTDRSKRLAIIERLISRNLSGAQTEKK